MKTWIFPLFLIIFYIGAAINSLLVGEWAKAGYWMSAALITFFITLI